VPAAVIESGLDYLQRSLREPDSTRALYRWESDVWLVYALHLHGRPQPKAALALYAQRQRRPLFGRALLLASLANLAGDDARRAKDTLAQEISDSLRVDGSSAHAEEQLHAGYQALMHSNDRTTGMVLHSLLAVRPDHPMVPRLVRWFLLGRREARFRNTQEAAWALLGIWDYARLREAVIPGFEAEVRLGREQLLRTQFLGHRTSRVLSRTAMARLLELAGGEPQSLLLNKRGRGTLYYLARLSYAPIGPPPRAKDHGLSVQRRVDVLDSAGRPLVTPRPPRVGDTLRITLEVKSSEARRFLVVDDPLPAGLEAVDPALATSSWSFGARDAFMESSFWDHHEVRDDRVLFFRDLMQPGKLVFRYLAKVSFFGEFQAPPVRAEEMYSPEVFGRGPATNVSYR
jgi:alpha-2-macroglobulin